MKVILTTQRTELAKELRRKGVELFANREYVGRIDFSNTITTVSKDNYLMEQ